MPVEVSHRWYIYYPSIHGKYLAFFGLTPASRREKGFRHPANQVGIWAYRKRFPEKYLASVRAYASADADAQALWGIPGLLVVGCLILVIRLASATLVVEGFLGKVLPACSLTILALCLPMASLQATLLAQGLAVLLALQTGLWLWGRFFLARSRDPGSDEDFVRSHGLSAE